MLVVVVMVVIVVVMVVVIVVVVMIVSGRLTFDCVFLGSILWQIRANFK